MHDSSLMLYGSLKKKEKKDILFFNDNNKQTKNRNHCTQELHWYFQACQRCQRGWSSSAVTKGVTTKRKGVTTNQISHSLGDSTLVSGLHSVYLLGLHFILTLVFGPCNRSCMEFLFPLPLATSHVNTGCAVLRQPVMLFFHLLITRLNQKLMVA